jgi:hypothetical protein
MHSWFTSILGNKPDGNFNQPLGMFNILGNYFQNDNEIPYIIFIWNNLKQIIGFTVINNNPKIQTVNVSLPNAEPVVVSFNGNTGSSTYTYFVPQTATQGIIFTNTITYTAPDNSTQTISRSQTVTPPVPTAVTQNTTQPTVNKNPDITITPTNANVGQTVTIFGNAYNSTDNLDVYIDGVFWDNYTGNFSISYVTTKPGPLNAKVVDTVANTNNSAYATILNTTNKPFLKDYSFYYDEQFEIEGVAWNGVDKVGLYIYGGTQFTSTTLLVTGYGTAKYIFDINSNITLDTGTYTIYVTDFDNNEQTPEYTITVASSPTSSTDAPQISYSNNVITATSYSGDTVAIYNGSSEVASGTTTATYTNTHDSTYTNYYAKDTTNNTVSNSLNVIGVANYTTNLYLNSNYDNYNLTSFSIANMFPNLYLNGNYNNYNLSSFSSANMFPNLYLNGNYNNYNLSSFSSANMFPNLYLNGNYNVYNGTSLA